MFLCPENEENGAKKHIYYPFLFVPNSSFGPLAYSRIEYISSRERDCQNYLFKHKDIQSSETISCLPVPCILFKENIVGVLHKINPGTALSDDVM